MAEHGRYVTGRGAAWEAGSEEPPSFRGAGRMAWAWTLALALLALGCAARTTGAGEAKWSWREAQAEVTPSGDLKWSPRPFQYTHGDSIRYIDFEKGRDANAGTSKAAPWKHHPWDPQAKGKAASCKGIKTYVFKRGVTYRGRLVARESGKPGDPIRLTSDPSWGRGEAVIAGSEIVQGWKKGAGRKDIPEAAKVWYAELPYAPRCVWMVAKDGKVTRIPLARSPNWKSDPDDHEAHWWTWTNERHPFKQKGPWAAYDSRHIKGKPADYFKDAIVYSEFGWVMGQPYPTKVEAVDTKTGAMKFARWTGGGKASIIFRGMRYYVEDKPQYLDDPNGEFWFDKKGAGGRLYIRLPGDRDPNGVRIEAGRYYDLLLGKSVKHVHVSGLAFRFTNQTWDLGIVPWNFHTKPWGFREDARPACIRVWGEGRDIRIANCTFEHVVMPIVMKATPGKVDIDEVLIEDNKFLHTDMGVMSLSDGTGWGFAHRLGFLKNVRVYRNYAREVGYRPTRYFNGTAMDFHAPLTLEVAGNVIERCGGQGINVVGGKPSGLWGDVPLSRVLIHHNKVWHSMQICNDYGGIEIWQHGPFYIYDNLSHDARGLREYNRVFNGKGSGFGHAYYLDGGFKAYLFNNIAWGLSNDPATKRVNCAAFQEIHSYQNTFFNNTVYNYYVGSRRQAPHAGRDKFLGNVWQGISKRVFRHARPAKTEAAGNEADAGPQKAHFAFETNTYANNVFQDVAELGVFEPSGRWLKTLTEFRSALIKRKSMAGGLGVMDKAPPLRDAAKGDFRLASGSAAIDRGVKVFVPWALSGVVGEWNFYHAGGDPKRIVDEHWYAKDYYTDRTAYHNMPMYPLLAVNVGEKDYENGPLEDWTKGALRFSAAKKQYAAASNARMEKEIHFKTRLKSRHEGGKPEAVTIKGKDLKTPQVYNSNFLIEVYFKTAPGKGGILVKKMADKGYALSVNGKGGVTFSVKGGAEAKIESRAKLNDGKWHHVIAEADRKAKTLALYVDGKKDASGAGLGAESLANGADLYVGGSPKGDGLTGAMDFLRICLGTLKDAKTSIEELYAWEFDGPFLRDFAGHRPSGARRDAGALEYTK